MPGAPEQVKVKGLADYLEVMSKSVFQTGISWSVVENKWPGIREAMRNFDPQQVASLSEKDIDTLAQDTRVIRNRRKLAGIVENARTLLAVDAEFGGFKKYLRSHADFEALVKDLKKRFSFLGDTGSYIFLYVVGEEVPPHEQWMQRRKK